MALRLEQQENDSSQERLIRLCDPKMTLYEIKMKAEKKELMTQLMGRAKKESMKDIMIVMKGLAEAQNKIDRKNLKAVTI